MSPLASAPVPIAWPSPAPPEPAAEAPRSYPEEGFVYLASQTCIRPHPWLSTTDKLDYPDQLILDLDPADEDFSTVTTAALRLRDCLADLGLASFVKTTCSRGLHVLVGLDRRADFAEVRAFARRMAERLWAAI